MTAHVTQCPGPAATTTSIHRRQGGNRRKGHLRFHGTPHTITDR